MAYNLKKAQKINDSVMPLSSALQQHNKDYDFSLDNEKQVNNFNTYLEKDRRENKNGPQTHEAMLDAVRKNAKQADKITEGGLDDSDSKLYPHRQFADGSDKYDVTPINMLSEAYDRKWRDAFKKVNKKADTLFWDKYVGEQLDDKQTKVLINMPQEGTQFQNNADRFTSLKGLPSDPDAEVNRKNFNKENKITPMVSIAESKSVRNIIASIQDADQMLFGTYVKAQVENRDLSVEEKVLVDTINSDKVEMLTRLAQIENEEKGIVPGFDAPPSAADMKNKKQKNTDAKATI